MWTAIVLCVVGWVALAVLAKMLIGIAIVLEVEGRRRASNIIGASGVFLLIVSFLSFAASIVLALLKLIAWINK